jgi:hypothetical protein
LGWRRQNLTPQPPLLIEEGEPERSAAGGGVRRIVIANIHG